MKERDPMPRRVRPMLATLVEEAFNKAGWLFEIKWDGYRAIAEVDGKSVNLYSRNLLPFNAQFPTVVRALAKLKHKAVLDGEIIALSKDGRPDFHALQDYGERGAPLQYALFDLLWLDGRDLRDRPLYERKALLASILPRGNTLILSAHIEGKGKAFFKEMQRLRFEGMLAKDALSPYREGARGKEWLKVKTWQEQEAVIVGYTAPRRSRKNLGALVLAANVGRGKNKKLSYIGHSGGGFTQKELRDLCIQLGKIKANRPPIDEKVPVNSPITWVRPKYVCEMRFSEWTPEGRMRHPIYTGMRPDKKPSEVVKEIPA